MQDGLRERKKRATRSALHDAAMRLTLERGLDHVTVEEISAEAGVSVRTFFNYFPAKEDAVIGDPIQVDEDYAAAAIATAPTLLDGLRAVALSMAADSGKQRQHVLLRWQLMERYPSLLPRMFARVAEFEAVLSRAIAVRTGDQPDDAYPQLMASIAGTAIRLSLRRWTAGRADRPHAERTLSDHVNEVFGLLGHGLVPEDAHHTRGGTS